MQAAVRRKIVEDRGDVHQPSVVHPKRTAKAALALPKKLIAMVLLMAMAFGDDRAVAGVPSSRGKEKSWKKLLSAQLPLTLMRLSSEAEDGLFTLRVIICRGIADARDLPFQLAGEQTGGLKPCIGLALAKNPFVYGVQLWLRA